MSRTPKQPPVPVVASISEVNAALAALSRAECRLLADLSGIPFPTLYARAGSRDMMLSTAHKIAEFLPAVRLARKEGWLPKKGEYSLWVRTKRAADVARAQAAMRAGA